ncbi:fatty acid desaturase [Myxococcus sp. CA051A]|uniref:fatty acid desaturase family protein n=1 Tax=unclassified Myxococcus TaxID=2648731 RepID=UPI00157B2D38|nr:MULTISPECIES: fatty acid desaturase [unclassified Myxococcus]NTX12360.1 fatty acid desaturase [Myxococcus sp. CA056]NTX33378.1 fatty acid desaturase [Myxococcus sp. CA033]NTX55050.1 fatty acid desaturase [Myxococcus sp. CA039A]NTX59515.1 fatty acid desaturase [Myxococcus sp. CA051A]
MHSTALSTATLPIDDPKPLRAELRRVMPPESFEPQPHRGVIALALVPVMMALMGLLGWGGLPWWLCLPLSFLLGQMVTTVGLAAHEALHHAVFRSRRWEEVLGWAGFSPFLVTPGNWRAWHVQAHHSAANIHQRDPDILPRQQDLDTQRFARLFHAISPGSGTWVSYISFGLFFTAQGQAFLWHHINQPQLQHVRMNRTKERLLTVLVTGGWFALGWAMGPRGALFALVIPLIVANVTLMIYIATNHWLLPASEDRDNPFVNTASVETHPVMNWAHLNFSYHQEHHIFPAMSPRFAPLLRQRLRELHPGASAVFPHVHALRTLYSRPALYSPTEGTMLVGRDGTPAVSTDELRRRLEAPRGVAS